jgi:UDP-glucose:(glucosyl)LPS alpha-1,2-glucosyltransferase
MSVIYKGQIIDTNLSRSAMGGTEQMRARLINGVDPSLLANVAIHISRVREIYKDVPNVFWAHDLVEDPETKILENRGWERFVVFVFVTCWQRDAYITRFGIPHSKCIVIENAIEPVTSPVKKNDGQIRLIYHTTPHRGLGILYSVFDALTKHESLKNKLHLDVFSSFAVYGWGERDSRYKRLFDLLDKHPNITNHGAKPNAVVREYLSKAHYFTYPCIWKETSCIALIEAIEHGVVAVHPNLAALPETAGQNTIMYDYTDDTNEHANRFYQTMLSVLVNDLKAHKVINSSPKHHINTFTNKWTTLLKEIQ